MASLNTGDILLVHPLGYGAEAAGRDISRMANIMPPLGLAGIAAYLDRRGLSCAIVDCYARPDSDALIRDYLRERRPAFIGLSCTTSAFHDGVRIAALARDVLPGIRSVFGGAHVSALKEKVLADYPQVDVAVVGEGEETLAELMENGGDAAGLPGLVTRSADGHVAFSGYRPGALDLDSLPFPAYEKLAGYPAAYTLPMFNYPRAPNSTCVTSRGCPYACSYCDRSVFRRSFRWNSADYMYEHAAHLRKRFGVRHLNFYDDQFTLNRERVVAFAERLARQPLGLTFNCAARAEHLDAELLALMRRAGCWMMSLGIENGDPAVLAQHRQNVNLDLVAEKVRLIRRAGIRAKGLFMIGLPGETEASVRKTMAYAFSLRLDDMNVAKFTPFPGSPVYETIREAGTFDEDWRRMDCMHFQFIPHGMTREQLESLFTAFYKAHFTQPRILLGYAAMLWRSPDSWRRFALNAGSFLRFARNDRRLGSA